MRLILIHFLVCAAILRAESSPPDFVRDVKPILETHCVRCHQEGKMKGGLRMDNR